MAEVMTGCEQNAQLSGMKHSKNGIANEKGNARKKQAVS